LKGIIVIAEAGVNHNGDIDLAKQLIDVAAEAGADVIKFQTFIADRLATRHAPKAEYQYHGTRSRETQHDMLHRLELTSEMHQILIDHCGKRNLEFLSTGFDTESVDMLVAMGIDRIKIPSGEITNLPYLRHVGQLGKPVILSTGMATLDEIGRALEVLDTSGTPREYLTVLHCNTAYPTPMEDVNLHALSTIKKTFGVKVGYSDHTVGIEVPVAAVALGASIIEKHFTLDRLLPGPDHRASLEPGELAAMVSAIRNIEMALGNGIKKPSPSETDNKAIVRKSLVAARPIRAGEKYTKDNVTVKRPGTGISPMCWDDVMELSAPRDLQPDDFIEL